MNSSSSTLHTRRALLLERCQEEREELVAVAAAARSFSPRTRAWAWAARALWRLMRVLSGHGNRNRGH